MAQEVEIVERPIEEERKDKRLPQFAGKIVLPAVPQTDMDGVEGDKKSLYNKMVDAESLGDALKEFQKGENRKNPLKLRIVGYDVGERDFDFTDKETGRVDSIRVNVVYLFTEDNRVIFAHSPKFLGDLAKLMGTFGTPSQQEDKVLTVEIEKQPNGMRTFYKIYIAEDEK